MTEQSPVVPSVGAVPVEVPEEAVEAAARALSLCTAADAGLDVFAQLAVEAAYPLIAARVGAEAVADERQRMASFVVELLTGIVPADTISWDAAVEMLGTELRANRDHDARVRAEERQRIATGLDLGELLDEYAAELGMPVADSDARDALVARYEDDLRALVLAPGSAVPVATPGATSLDAAGIMRRFDQEISRSRDVIGRMDMGRTGGSVATPTEPTEPVDEVVCPNCEHTIRARMSDQPDKVPTHEQLHSAANLAWPCRYRDGGCPLLIRQAAQQDGQR